ncbi:MAG TPA: methyltransferase domain-containing protein [Acidiferrobacteraceae bacterium]|nr:methyltransferase domain-containing protein [Acidiferrobacteraceae bacterium]
MSCCCPHSRSASRFFSFFAGRYRKRFEKKGFEPSQKQLMKGLEQAGYQGSKVLEIGSGVGHLHQTLLEQGARSAVGVDLAPKMIDEARHWAQDRSLADRTQYILGDFMEISDSLSDADVTVLDKVVCCYPDADGLVHGTLSKTNRVYALTYPRDRWYVRAIMGVMAGAMKIVRSDFRPYVHDPRMVEKWITGAGFSKQYQDHNLVWLSQVYVKT